MASGVCKDNLRMTVSSFSSEIVKHTASLVNWLLWGLRTLCNAPFDVVAECGLLDRVSEGLAAVEAADARGSLLHVSGKFMPYGFQNVEIDWNTFHVSTSCSSSSYSKPL